MSPVVLQCVIATGASIARIANALPEEVRQTAHKDMEFQVLESAVNDAALTGDIAATRRACKVWWASWQAVLTKERQG